MIIFFPQITDSTFLTQWCGHLAIPCHLAKDECCPQCVDISLSSYLANLYPPNLGKWSLPTPTYLSFLLHTPSLVCPTLFFLFHTISVLIFHTLYSGVSPTLGRFVLVLRHCGQSGRDRSPHRSPLCVYLFSLFLFHTIPGMVFFIFLSPSPYHPT